MLSYLSEQENTPVAIISKTKGYFCGSVRLLVLYLPLLLALLFTGALPVIVIFEDLQQMKIAG